MVLHFDASYSESGLSYRLRMHGRYREGNPSYTVGPGERNQVVGSRA